MKVVIDKVKVARRAQNANTASIGGLVLMMAGVILPILVPSQSPFISLGMILVGMVISMMGVYQANRWVRKPRPEELLSKALKGLDDKYVLYHYPSLPCDHVLLTPEGVVNLETINLAGKYVYKEGRWKERMPMGRALRSVVEERLGDPTKSSLAIQRFMTSTLAEVTGQKITVKPVIAFTHPDAVLELEAGGPVPVYTAKTLKKHVTIEGPRLSPEAYESIAGFLEKATLG